MLRDRYINPFAGFTFKKLLDEEANKSFSEFEESVLEKLFRVAELRQFSRDEQMEYEQSLKYYRDMQNVIDTARREERYDQQEFTAQMMLRDNESIEKIERYTGLSKQEIERLREQF